ncbi:hypothetical protein SMF913_28597 [Streptomyces malaysiensis]|uniref:Uncharacterized protein n=1 Tax=Streptomyces malaysiensis TaxID=92644 RepID=A0A2J7YYP1_STRMQ|nr:hypothetical protein SMF913_28597 [Streptomyces malaysiensis]
MPVVNGVEELSLHIRQGVLFEANMLSDIEARILLPVENQILLQIISTVTIPLGQLIRGLLQIVNQPFTACDYALHRGERFLTAPAHLTHIGTDTPKGTLPLLRRGRIDKGMPG